MFPRNATTCKKCFKVFCCKNHRKNHENRCCARVQTPCAQAGVGRAVGQSQIKSELKQHVTQRPKRKRKFEQSLTFLKPIGVATAIICPRKILRAHRQKNRIVMEPSLPSIVEEEGDVEEQPSNANLIDSARPLLVNSGDAYHDFRRGSLLTSPIEGLPGVASISDPIADLSTPSVDLKSTPMPKQNLITTLESAATPLTFQVPRAPHHAKLTAVFKTSTPKENDEQQEAQNNEAPDPQYSSSEPPKQTGPGANSDLCTCLTDSIEESPITSEPVNEVPAVNGDDGNKRTFCIKSDSPFVATPMTSEGYVRQCNLIQKMTAGTSNQPDPSASNLVTNGHTFVVGDPAKTSCYFTPSTGKKKKVSWSSDTYDSTTPYYSARSHFSSCCTPVTPLPNPSLFTSVKDAFKNLVCKLPGTSEADLEPQVRKRLKLMAEAKIKCRPTYKGRYPKSRSYLVFSDD